MSEFKSHKYLQSVYRQISNFITTSSEGSELIQHGAEKGLGNEEIIRNVFKKILPIKYAVTKGKIINSFGQMSKHVDLIVYDAINCPSLYIDEHQNKIVPIEGVYFVAEIKTKLNKTKIKESYENIKSIKKLKSSRYNASINNKISIIPPLSAIIAFKDDRKLDTIYNNYVEFSRKYEIDYNAYSYSESSPGYLTIFNNKYLIDDIVVIKKGMIYHMYDQVPVKMASKIDTFGIFLVGLLNHLQEIRLKSFSPLNYFDEINIMYEPHSKYTDGSFYPINICRTKLAIDRKKIELEILEKEELE